MTVKRHKNDLVAFIFSLAQWIVHWFNSCFEAHFADKSNLLTLIFKMRVVQASVYSIRFLFPPVKSRAHLKYVSARRLHREQCSKGQIQFSCEAEQIYWGHKTWTTWHLHSLSVQETRLLADMLRLPFPVIALGSYAFHTRENSVFLLFSITNKLQFSLKIIGFNQWREGNFTSLHSPCCLVSGSRNVFHIYNCSPQILFNLLRFLSPKGAVLLREIFLLTLYKFRTILPEQLCEITTEFPTPDTQQLEAEDELRLQIKHTVLPCG